MGWHRLGIGWELGVWWKDCSRGQCWQVGVDRWAGGATGGAIAGWMTAGIEEE